MAIWCLVLLIGCSVSRDLDREVLPDATVPEADAAISHDVLPDPDSAVDAPLRRPLILALHGYGAHGAAIYDNFHLEVLADRAVILAPDGDYQAWDSGASSCCLSHHGGTEAQLVELVTARIAAGDIDPERVYVWGQSNGGAMAWRLACDRPDIFRVAVAQAGNANSASDAPCAAGTRAILQVHGTADPVISYATSGTINGMPEPYVAVIGPGGALAQVAQLSGCSGTLEVVGHPPITNNGNKDVMRWSGGCTSGYAEHWRFVNGGHSPTFDGTWPEALFAWSEAHGS